MAVLSICSGRMLALKGMIASKLEARLRKPEGFTLVEMLVSMVVLVFIMVLVAQMIATTGKIWKNTTAKIESFQSARDAFQSMTDQLRQATVNTYYDYFNKFGFTQTQNSVSASPENPFSPKAYGRKSELHFISGSGLLPGQITQAVFFQAPLGFPADKPTYGAMQNLLTATGFFIEFGDGTNVVNSAPGFLPVLLPRYRYRLMQFIQPTESLSVYDYSFPSPSTSTSISPNIWFTTPITTAATHKATVRALGENIIGLIIWPKITDSTTDTLAPNFSFDSRMGLKSLDPTTTAPASWTPGTGPQPLQMNQMPPLLQVAMIAIDEPSAKQLQGGGTTAPAAITNAFAQKNTFGETLFTSGAHMETDLIILQTGAQGLASIVPHLNFRIFNTTLAVRSARFSIQ